jgi:hypothetical protein
MYFLPHSLQRNYLSTKTKNSVVSLRKRTITTERRRMSAKLVQTFWDRGCRVISATDPYGGKYKFSASGAANFPFK